MHDQSAVAAVTSVAFASKPHLMRYDRAMREIVSTACRGIGWLCQERCDSDANSRLAFWWLRPSLALNSKKGSAHSARQFEALAPGGST